MSKTSIVRGEKNSLVSQLTVPEILNEEQLNDGSTDAHIVLSQGRN